MKKNLKKLKKGSKKLIICIKIGKRWGYIINGTRKNCNWIIKELGCWWKRKTFATSLRKGKIKSSYQRKSIINGQKIKRYIQIKL